MASSAWVAMAHAGEMCCTSSLLDFFFGYSPMHEFFLRKYFPYAQFAIELIKNNATLFY